MTILNTITTLFIYAAVGVNLLLLVYVLLRLSNVTIPRRIERAWKKFRRFRRRLFQRYQITRYLVYMGLNELGDARKVSRDELVGIGLIVTILALCFIGMIITAPQL